MGLSSTKALQAKPEARDSTALWPGGSITQFIPAQVSQCQSWVADRPPTLGGSQRSGVLREARALGCRGMDEAREWCWAGIPGLPPSVQLPQNPGSSSPSALLSAPFSLPLFLSLHPSTFCISLAHLSSSIPGLSAPFLFLSTSLSLSLILFPFLSFSLFPSESLPQRRKPFILGVSHAHGPAGTAWDWPGPRPSTLSGSSCLPFPPARPI